jgi:hypothetical protein
MHYRVFAAGVATIAFIIFGIVTIAPLIAHGVAA